MKQHISEPMYHMQFFSIIKGQLISKCLFGVFTFFQNTNENKLKSIKVEFVRSFFGRNVGMKKLFRIYLTFTKGIFVWGDASLTICDHLNKDDNKKYSWLKWAIKYTNFLIISTNQTNISFLLIFIYETSYLAALN